MQVVILPERKRLCWLWLMSSILPLALASIIALGQFGSYGVLSPIAIWPLCELFSVAISLMILRRGYAQVRRPSKELTLNVDSRGRWQLTLGDLISVAIFAALAMLVVKILAAELNAPTGGLLILGMPIALGCAAGYTVALLILSREGYCYEGVDKWLWGLGAVLGWIGLIFVLGVIRLFVLGILVAMLVR